jgi:hypothetical protein
MGDVAEVARKRALTGFRVGYRMNDKGECVVALIFPPSHPDSRSPQGRG